MSIAVTGAAGHLGSHVIKTLIHRGIPAESIVAIVRNPAKATDLAEVGVTVRTGDYDDPHTLNAALEGSPTLLLISSPQIGSRVPQHLNVIKAAAATDVQHITYTSVLHADTSKIGLAAEHYTTERAITDTAIPFTFLRNGWYWENFTNNVRGTGLVPSLKTGVLLGSGGNGRLAGAARADYAEAAANVLTTPEHAGKTYELGGERLTYTEFAEIISTISGTPITYRNLTEAQYRDELIAAGLQEPHARILASYDAGIARDELDTTTGDLQRLIGRLPTPLAETIKNAIA